MVILDYEKFKLGIILKNKRELLINIFFKAKIEFDYLSN
jgi:hypothetical protein